MRRAVLCTAIIGVIIGIFYLRTALQYPVGTLQTTGPGLYPLFVAALLLASSLGTGVGTLLKATAQDQIDWPHGTGWWRLAAIIAALLIYIIMLPYMGHAIATVVVSLIALQAMGGFRWYLKILLSVAIGVGSHFLFENVLGVPIPKGIWFQ